MKDDERQMTTVTTATLELGIDIGRLERAFQGGRALHGLVVFAAAWGARAGAANLPRCGSSCARSRPRPALCCPRACRGSCCRASPSCSSIWRSAGWSRPRPHPLPYSLLYHQTMSTLASCGELSPAELARRVLTLSPFAHVSLDDFRVLLQYLVQTDHVEQTEGGGLIVGMAGERLTNSFKFYAVFQENEEYTVRSESQEIGTIVKPPPVGERIALAGHVWIVEEIDHKRHLIYATKVKGKVPAYFGDCPGDINTHVLERMRQVLREGDDYPYLMPTRRPALRRHVTWPPTLASRPSRWCAWAGHVVPLPLAGHVCVLGPGALPQAGAAPADWPARPRPVASLLYAVQDGGGRALVLPGAAGGGRACRSTP